MKWKTMTPLKIEPPMEGSFREVKIENHSLLIGLLQGEPFCLENRCSHQERRMNEGILTQNFFQCPHHVVRFCVRTGAVLFDGGFKEVGDIKIYPIRIVDGVWEVQID